MSLSVHAFPVAFKSLNSLPKSSPNYVQHLYIVDIVFSSQIWMKYLSLDVKKQTNMYLNCVMNIWKKYSAFIISFHIQSVVWPYLIIRARLNQFEKCKHIKFHMESKSTGPVWFVTSYHGNTKCYNTSVIICLTEMTHMKKP